MFTKLAILSGLMISVSCVGIHQVAIPVVFHYPENPDYNFAYEVNNANTGDVKSQHENRRGGLVSGQYSLLQPDGVRRTVDYRADDIRGFRATVNNEGRPNTLNRQNDDDNNESVRNSDMNMVVQANPQGPDDPRRPTPTQVPNVTPLPVAVSRTSFVQHISNSHPVIHNPWI